MANRTSQNRFPQRCKFLLLLPHHRLRELLHAAFEPRQARQKILFVPPGKLLRRRLHLLRAGSKIMLGPQGWNEDTPPFPPLEQQIAHR